MKHTRAQYKDCSSGLRNPIQIRNNFSHIFIAMLIVICIIGIYSTSVLANPTGSQVEAGSATITTPAPNTVQINQASDKAIINWQSFNIRAGEKTQFLQPSVNSIALNRINPSQGASQIFGSLTANGQIILINQAGIYFASGAEVNVGSIIASTIDMTNQNFLAGKYIFDQPSHYSGSIINKGTIIATQNGLVALIGSGISNEGLIQANLGSVILASGSKFTITLSGSELISFTIDGEAMSAGVDQNGKTLKSGVSNSGQIIANGGKILITAQTASSTLDNAINMTGVMQAQSVSEKNGEIILSASPGSGIVRVAAILDVSGKNTGEKGGKVKIIGPTILIEAPTIIDASGNTNGGEILIGGNLHGAGPETNAFNTTINSSTLIAANALEKGNGGKVIVWANNATNYFGHISATGGAAGGDGGFAEVSGKQLLHFRGTVDLSAVGSIGTLLLDPENLTIQSIGPTTATLFGSTYTSNIDNSILTVADLQAALTNANVLVQTGLGGLQAGDITVANNVTWNNLNTLTLSAFRNINMNATITNSSGGGLTLKADNTGIGDGAILFSGVTPQITMSGGGVLNFYYNPASFPTPTNFSSNVNISGGTTFTPYMLVNNLINLQNMNNNLNGNYALGTNIDASATSGWNAGAGFVPVGTNAANFTGKFDGQNHTIDSLTIFLPLADSVGLFGYVNSSGMIQNVGLTNTTITGLTNVGALIGYDAAGAVNNAYSTGSVTSDAISNHVGGLIGFSGGNVSNAYSTATVLAGAASNYIGGLIGQASAGVSNSYHAIGSVTAGAISTYVGGLIGYSGDSVSHAYNTGPVVIGATGSANFGGLIGYSAGNVYYSYNTGAVTAGAAVTNVGGLVGYGLGTINNSYSTGFITTGATGSTNIGGLVGFAGNNVSNSYSNSGISGGAANNNIGGLVGQNNATISNSYSTGNVAAGAGSTFLGGLVGLNNTTVNNSFWDIQTSAQLASAGGTGKTTAEMMQQTTFCPSGNCAGDPTHFDFATNWGIVNGVTYPYLLAATLIYTANTTSITYGGTIPLFSGTVTGFVGSETQATATMGTLAFTSPATSTSNVGSYAITGSGLTANNDNYVFTQAAGNATALTITTAPLTITATNQSKTYGDTLALGTSAFTPTGLQNSETVGSVTLASAGAIASANVSSSPYAITPSAAIGGTFTASNYSISYVDGMLTVNPATLTYNANTGTMTYGSSVPTLSGTVTGFVNNQTQGSSTTGTLAFTSPATSSSNVGSYSIDGSGLTANNGNYVFTQAAGNATALTITTAPLTITATNQSKTYGDTLALGTSAFTPTGLQNSETVGSVTLASAGAIASANVSSSPYAITPSAAIDGTFTASNYSISYVDGVLTINPATLTYNANTGAMTYGSSVPTLSGTVTGFVNNQTQGSSTTGTLAFTSPATSSSNVGSYSIDGSGLTANNGNYVFTQAAGNATALTITTAPLTITATNQSKMYGDTLALGTSAFTPTGLQNSETVGSVTLASAGAIASANVSSSPYAITPSAAIGGTFTASNYSISYVDGVLTVNPATLTYNANTGTMTYGSSVPTLSGTVTGFVNNQTQGSSTTGTLAFTSPATSSSNVSSYSIDGSGLTANNGNYVFTQAAGNATALTITTAPLTITATNQSKMYGDTLALGTSAFTPTGLQNSETVGSVTLASAGAIASANVSSSPYAISPSAAIGGTFTASNYSISYLDGVLTVNPATLTYNANTGTMTYGSSVPTLSGTITGFVNSQTQAGATTGTLAFTSPATSTSNVGNYAITGSGLTANNGNYVFTQAAGNATALTITTAPLTITATNQSKTYGDTLALGTSAFTPTGLQNSETVGSVTLASAGAIASANVSSSPYAITPSAAIGGTFTASNYSISYVDGVLTVNPATLIYNANTGTMTYGSSVPTLSGTVTGFVNSQTQAGATTGTLAFTSPATSTSNVGSYAITGSGLTANNDNYVFTQAAGNATALTITAGTSSIPLEATVVPLIISNTIPSTPLLPLIADIVTPVANRDNYTSVNTNEHSDISIINNMDLTDNIKNITIENTTLENVTRNLSNAIQFTSEHIVSTLPNQFGQYSVYSFLNNDNINQQNSAELLSSASNYNNGHTIAIYIFISLVILLFSLLALYWLYMLIWSSNDIAKKMGAQYARSI